MYHHLRGRLTHLEPTFAVLEAGGVGYGIMISLNTHRTLPPVGTDGCMLLTHLHVTDAAQTLYGFADEAERGLFRALISVSGVGPATAMQILSRTTAGEFAQMLTAQDHGALKRVKGIGEKTARRILLELKDTALGEAVAGAAAAPGPAAEDDDATVRQALETLGLTPRDASARLEKVRKASPGLSVEETIRQALQ
jgi:Holliday junction DNA helicase RuvA